MRGRVLSETLITWEPTVRGTEGSPPLLLDVSLNSLVSGERCRGGNKGVQMEQHKFCQDYDGYCDLCTCDPPFLLSEDTFPPGFPMKENIPITIVTANNPHHLYRLLKNLRWVAGAGQTEVVVVVDGPHEETIRLTRLFGHRVIVHTPQGVPGENTRTNSNIAFALHTALSLWPAADKVILLEDDLLLAPDLLRYFHQTAWLLDTDSSLSFVGAFGQNSYPTTAACLDTVLRVEMYPQYGWMTSRRWVEHILPLWVPQGGGRDWDWWLYTEGPRGGKDALVPEVSRTGHAGAAGGAHVTGWEQHLFFNGRLISDNVSPVLTGLPRLVGKNYSEWMDQEIRHAKKLRLSAHPCHVHPVPANQTGPFVLFLGVVSRADPHNAFFLLQTTTYNTPTAAWIPKLCRKSSMGEAGMRKKRRRRRRRRIRGKCCISLAVLYLSTANTPLEQESGRCRHTQH
ncbi:protein O-linked-mannose beta-1,2-N-acetylglucosaminyltransferase 1-like isoform X2 [Portunus trituberculatus]|uniref:protein O-linked-mannose beta-1,2-N-acetylglucosaminyltransferase 1-like isoform X2 n=1 Tax=Portunus trituberculatus TaxID=210409 RepID=UPI001E1CD6EA|nr:protein O-linked-mannose beta-1,2-N-acetylglucosaminyltransferase 1-like isoform X2 [Portunus trituberculatus]